MTQAIDETNIPRYALFRGKRVRVIEYKPEGSTKPFKILDHNDEYRFVTREQLTFVKPPKGKK